MFIFPMKQIKYLVPFILIFAFTLMIVNKCIFIGSGKAVLAFCYEMEDDIESKGNKSDYKKETEKFCNPFDELVHLTTLDVNHFHLTLIVSFAEGHPSQPDLPPES